MPARINWAATATCMFLACGEAAAQCDLHESTVIHAPTPIEGARFGESVGVDGDLAMIGAPGELPSGAAYVFRHIGGTWTFEARLTVNGLAAGERFGGFAAASGDRVMVATNAAGAFPRPWTAFIFRLNSGTWIEEARFAYLLTRAGTGAQQLIDIDGERAVVAGLNGGDPAVAAYVYQFDGTEWQSESPALCDAGGFSDPSLRYVDLDGERLLVGHIDFNLHSCFEPEPGEGLYQSAVYAASKGGWVREATLSEAGGKMGLSGAIRGELVVATGEINPFGTTDRHGAQLFARGDGSWPFQDHLVPPERTSPGIPGGCAFIGDQILVGSPWAPPMQGIGELTLFSKAGGEWSGVANYTASDALNNDHMGQPREVSANERQILVGFGGRDHGGLTNPGVVYVFDAADCNGNGLPDGCPGDCEGDPLCADCNGNGVGDGCDEDCDGSSVPDDCECLATGPVMAEPDGVNKSRYISFAPPSGCQKIAIRVTLRSLHHPQPANLPCCPGPDLSAFEAGPGCIEGPAGCVRWVGPPGVYVDSVNAGSSFQGAMLQCEPFYHDWSDVDVLHVTGAEVAPSSVYEVQTIDQGCDPGEASSFSDILEVATGRWADVAAPFQDTASPFPPSQPNVIDIGTVVDKLKDVSGAAARVGTQLSPRVINLVAGITVVEIGQTVDAVKGFAYPHAGPMACGPK